MTWNRCLAMGLAVVLASVSAAWGEGPKQVLLLGMKRDHPEGRHEYMAGLRLLAKCLEDVPQIKAQVVAADEPWPQGPELLKKADGVVLYLGQGAKWIQASPERMAAIQELAKRGGGITALHMAIMSKDPQYIEAFRDLVGGCHGGADRRFIVMDGDVRVVDRGHPITQGVEDVRVHDEFYYQLKFSRQGKIHPLSQVLIEGQMETVGWAYERLDGGRSAGFSGMDPHANWRQTAYRRLATQAILWTLRIPVPEGGLAVRVTEEELREPAK